MSSTSAPAPAPLLPEPFPPLHAAPTPAHRSRRPRASALPADFFRRHHSADKSADAKLHLQRLRFHRALSMPSQHRWVADWLFADSNHPFHRNIPVPPEAFDSTLAVQISHTFYELGGNATSTAPKQCPITGRTVASQTADASFRISDADLVLLPVACLDGITVGYVFGSGRYESAAGVVKKGNPFCGRFAFNRRDDDLLMVVNGRPPSPDQPCAYASLTVLMTVSMAPGRQTKSHCFFSCPYAQYSFENLPNRFLTAMCAEGLATGEETGFGPYDMLDDLLALSAADMGSSGAFNGFPAEESGLVSGNLDSTQDDVFSEMLFKDLSSESSPLSSDFGGEPAEMSGAIDFVESMLTEQPGLATNMRGQAVSTYGTPWDMGSFTQTRDGVGVPRIPGHSGTSSGAFARGSLHEAIEGLCNVLRGSYKTTRPKKAEDPMAGMPGGEETVHVVATLQEADACMTATLRRRAATLFFEATVSVRRDEGRVRAWAGVEILPRVDAGDGGLIEGTGTTEDRQEMKKRRNRMSAARSNEKRKQRNELHKKRLGELKGKAGELERRRRALLVENEALRARVERERRHAPRQRGVHRTRVWFSKEASL